MLATQILKFFFCLNKQMQSLFLIKNSLYAKIHNEKKYLMAPKYDHDDPILSSVQSSWTTKYPLQTEKWNAFSLTFSECINDVILYKVCYMTCQSYTSNVMMKLEKALFLFILLWIEL